MALAAGLAFVVAAVPAPAFPDRPAPAHTGGFGEPTCLACHFDGELNPPEGSLVVEGWPTTAAAGRPYALTVRLRSSDMARSGFQLAVRTPDGDQMGRLVPGDGRSAVVDSGGVSYLHHTSAGSFPTSAGEAEWRFTWIPTGGDARLHVSANAANGDASNFGDAIYAYSLSVCDH